MTSEFHQNRRKCSSYQYLTCIQLWTHLDNFQVSIANFCDFGYNMGIPIHFLPTSDKSGVKIFLYMQSCQFFQETCKTKLYENSKKPGLSARANFSEFYENLQGGGTLCPPPNQNRVNLKSLKPHSLLKARNIF